MIGWAPFAHVAEALAAKYKNLPDVKHWRKFTTHDQREHYARVFGPHKTVDATTYASLKNIAGPYNRG